MSCLRAASALGLALLPWPVLAQGGAGLAPGIGQMIAGLLLVLGLIVAAAWLARRYMPNAGGSGVVRVLGGQALGARERVVLVEVQGVRLLLGVAPGRVQALHVFAPGEGSFDAALAAARPQSGGVA